MRKLFYISLCASAAIFLTACLKDKNIEDRVYGTDGVGDVKTVLISASKITGHEGFASINSINLPFSNNDTTVDLVTVHLASDQPAAQEIQVVLDTTFQFLNVYNDSTDKHYVKTPSSIYSFPDGLVVKIPKGSKDGSIRIKIKSSDLVAKEYGFGFKIKSVSDPSYVISGNYDNQVVLIGVKNKYDAVYTLKTRFRAADRPTVNTSTTWEWPWEVALITTGTSSVKMYDIGGYDLFARPIQTNPPGWSRFGQVEPSFVFDPATDKVTSVTNDIPSSLGRALEQDATVTTSKFDPSNRNVYVTYIMTQPGFGPLQISDTLTFERER